MIGKITRNVAGNVAGRSLQRSVRRIATGPTGAVLEYSLPTVLPRASRRFGTTGMLAAALGGVVLGRWLMRRQARHPETGTGDKIAAANRPEAVLGGPPLPPGS